MIPKISVAIPAYKKKYLQEAILSILNQSFKDFELIIVNDASPEYLDEIVNSFSDERIRYYKNEINLGAESVVKNWNKCLEYANGEYFVLAADDDYYETDFLKELYNLAKENPDVDLFHCRVRTVDEEGKLLSVTQIAAPYESIFDLMYHRIVFSRLSYVGDFMCRTSSLRAIGGFVNFPYAWSSDVATWFTLARTNGVAYSSKVLFNYRYSNQNITNSNLPFEKFRATYEFNEWMREFIEQLNPSSNIDTEIKELVKVYLPNFIQSSYLNALISGKSNIIIKEFRIIFNWLRLKKTYKLSIKFLCLALLKVIKNANA